MNGRLDLTTDPPMIRFERHLPHPVDRVWRAITEPADLAAWFPGIPRFEPLAAGAEFVVEGEPGGGGRIAELDPPRLLAYDWNGERLRFELAPDGDGCRLTFSHALGDLALGAQTAAGWEICLDRLDAQLDGEPVGEREALTRWPELHEGYAQQFGLDPEVGRRTFAEHPAAQ